MSCCSFVSLSSALRSQCIVKELPPSKINSTYVFSRVHALTLCLLYALFTIYKLLQYLCFVNTESDQNSNTRTPRPNLICLSHDRIVDAM